MENPTATFSKNSPATNPTSTESSAATSRISSLSNPSAPKLRPIPPPQFPPRRFRTRFPFLKPPTRPLDSPPQIHPNPPLHLPKPSSFNTFSFARYYSSPQNP